jgi:hypothetical protein
MGAEVGAMMALIIIAIFGSRHCYFVLCPSGQRTLRRSKPQRRDRQRGAWLCGIVRAYQRFKLDEAGTRNAAKLNNAGRWHKAGQRNPPVAICLNEAWQGSLGTELMRAGSP